MSKFPWWGWLLVLAGVQGGALSLDWFARFGWAVGSGATESGIEFVEGSDRPNRPTLPVAE